MHTIPKRALIDKAKFGNLFILGFKDKNALIEMGVLEDNPKSKIKYVMPNGDSFTRLNIHDSLIDKLFASSSAVGSGNMNYCHLELSIHGEKGNLNCYTAAEYYDYLLMVQKHLKQNYGIMTDFSDLRLRGIEINRTFQISSEFKTYHRVIELLWANLPKSLKKQSEFREVQKEGIEHESYYATSRQSNKSDHYIELKVYNKTKQLQKIVVLEEQYMRVEIKLTGSQKIKNELKTNSFAELTDELINRYFQVQMEKMFINPYYQWVKARNKEIITLMKFTREENKNHWIINTLRVLQNREITDKKPHLLDIEELIPLVNELGYTDKKIRYQIKTIFRKQAQRYESCFCNKDDLKLKELLEKIQVDMPEKNGSKVA